MLARMGKGCLVENADMQNLETQSPTIGMITLDRALLANMSAIQI